MVTHQTLTPVDCELRDVTGAEVFCPTELLHRCLGKVDFAQRILDRFLGGLPVELRALEEANQSGDVVCVAQIAHRLKGAAANIAAKRLRSLAAEVESLGRQERIPQINEVLQRLRIEADLFARVVQQWRKAVQQHPVFSNVTS